MPYRKLTFKSMSPTLQDRVADRSLAQYLPALRQGEAIRRGLFLTPQVERWINERPNAWRAQEFKSFVRARLSIFVKGGPIDNFQYMKRLRGRSPEVWEIRIREFTQTRIFGAFYEPNTFICTNIRVRDELARFGGWASAEERATKRWDDLFPGRRRFTGTKFTNYVTENGVHCDW